LRFGELSVPARSESLCIDDRLAPMASSAEDLRIVELQSPFGSHVDRDDVVDVGRCREDVALEAGLA
jgi:hypothetical protein